MIGIIGLCFVLLLLILGVPIAFTLAVVGIVGTSFVVGFDQTLAQVSLVYWKEGTEFIIICIPLFVLMGQLVFHSDLATDLYSSVRRWLGWMPGGLAISTVFACGGFAAVTGSSVASVATMGAIAYPELKRYKYAPGLATGVLAASGTLGILIPPSTGLVFYGILTDTSIAKLFIAGIIPGILTILIYSGSILVRCLINPSLGPVGPKFTLKEKIASLKGVWPIILIFVFVLGGLYGGVFTPTEASGMGVFSVLVVSLLMRRLTWERCKRALHDTGLVTAMVFAIIVGGYLISRFLAVTGLTNDLVDFINTLGLTRLQFLIILTFMYLILGAILDVFGMVILTIPFVFPISQQLGIDPVWFGIYITIMTEIALVTPPIGVNVYVIYELAETVPMSTCFKGIAWFTVGDLLLVALLVIFPQIPFWI